MNEELALQIKAYDEFTAIMGKFSGALESVDRSEKAVTAATESVNKAVQVMMDAMQKTGPPTQQTAKGLDEVAEADKKAASAAKEHKDKIDGLVQGLAALGILREVKQGLTEVSQAGGEFDRQLAIIKGATGQARDATQEYLMSLPPMQQGVTDLSKGLVTLGFAGYDVQKSMAALPDLAQFSTASFQDMGEAMAPVVTVAKAYGMAIDEAGQITDTITLAQNRSAMEFKDFQLGLAMSAGVARMAGQDYRELITVLSVLRDAGLGASDAGTSIKSAWLALMNPTEEARKVMKDLGIQVYDSQGHMKSWADIVDIMNRALAPLNDQSRNLALTTILGSDGIRAMAMSMQRGSEYIRGMTADLKDSRGATAAMAAEMGDTWTGAMQRAQADMERMKITLFGDLKGAFSGVLEAVDALVVGFNSLSPGMRTVLEFLVGGVGLIAAVGAVALLIRTTLIPVIEGLNAALADTAVEAAAANTALSAGAIGLVLAGVMALAGAYMYFKGKAEEARVEQEKHDKALTDLAAKYDQLTTAMNDSGKSEAERTKAGQDQKDLIRQIGDQFPELVRRWNEHGEAVELDTKRLNENTEAARKNKQAKAQDDVDDAQAALDKANRKVQEIKDLIARTKAEIQRSPQIGLGDVDPDEAAKQLQAAIENVDTAYAGQLRDALKAVDRAQGQLAQKLAEAWGTADIGNDNLRAGITHPGVAPGQPGTAAGSGNYDPKADEAAKKAEQERVAAIKDQVDLLKHLIAMDDQRVDTAQEQLQWLERIRATYGTTRDLDEQIHKLETEISRQPLQDQLDAFEKRKQLGEVTARDEQQFYEDLLANADKLNLTVKERQQYEVQAAVAKKQADKEAFDTMMADTRYNIEVMDASTSTQLAYYKWLRDSYAQGTEERKQLDLDVHRLEKQLASEQHDRRMAEIEFDSITQRWTNDQKLAKLRQYLETEKNLTLEQKHQLQQEIAQMEQQAESDHQQKLLDLYREGLEAQRRVQEKSLRDRQQADEKGKQKAIDDEKARYEGLINPLQQQLQLMQQQSQELERQNRLLELQKSLREKEQDIADAKAIKNRIVVEAGGPFGFTIRRTYDEAKVRDLEKDRAKIADDLANEQAKQAREREQEAIQSRIKALETERDARLKTLNGELADMRTKHQEEQTTLSTYWDGRLSQQSLKLDLEKTAWKDHYDDVLKQTNQWVTDMNGAWSKLQAPTMTSAADLVKSLGGTTAPPVTPAAGTSGAAPAQTKVEVNNYGDHNYNGVAGVEQAAAGLVAGFAGRLSPRPI